MHTTPHIDKQALAKVKQCSPPCFPLPSLYTHIRTHLHNTPEHPTAVTHIRAHKRGRKEKCGQGEREKEKITSILSAVIVEVASVCAEQKQEIPYATTHTHIYTHTNVYIYIYIL